MKYLSGLLLVSLMLGSMAPSVDAQTVDLDELCQRFPLNSRCEGYTPQDPESVNSLEAPLQVINVHLDVTGSDSEIVVFEINQEIMGDITLSAYHIEKTEDDAFFSLGNLINGAVGTVSPVPTPVDLFRSFVSQASQAEYIAFTPDTCSDQIPPMNAQGLQLADCSIVGDSTLSLSEDVDIRSGFFTLRYTEGALSQIIFFRLSEHDAEFVGDLRLDSLCQRFPLNSRCRYWPLSQTES